jgi:hypothetical protein
MSPSPRQLRFAYIIYAVALIVLALAHTVNAQTTVTHQNGIITETRPNPYTDPDGFVADIANNPPTGWSQHTSPVRPDCVGVYGNTVWMCPGAPSPTAPTEGNLLGVYSSSPSLPQTASRTLMFGNVVTGKKNEAQDYVPFLNLANGWQPQAFIVTIVTATGHWQQSYDMPAYRHQSINLQDVPILAGKVTSFGVFVQAWGVATATVSLHRGADPWGPTYQTIQPDAMATPLFMTADR